MKCEKTQFFLNILYVPRLCHIFNGFFLVSNLDELDGVRIILVFECHQLRQILDIELLVVVLKHSRPGCGWIKSFVP